jgi:streptomycin 3"-adenylyltransferase
VTQLRDLVAVVRAVLGDAAIGGYLHGSTGTGRQQPTSDTDLLVVTTRPMTPGERRALVTGIMPLSGRRAVGGPARPIELTVVVQDDVRPWRLPPMRDFQYGEWERDGYEAGELPDRRPDPDLAPLLTMVLAASKAAFGPPPAAILDRVPPGDLIRAVAGMMPGLLLDLDGDTRNVLLTLARILVTVETGELVAKDEAADRVLGRLDDRCATVLRRARDAYHGPDYGSFEDLAADVGPCADALVAAIDAAVASRGG